MKYQIAERFKSLQGEGVFAGTPMAFIRFVGCSVGKKICQHCDTTFERVLPWQGGGEYTPEELADWSRPYEHICLTGGEPMDQNLEPLIAAMRPPDGHGPGPMIHVETSGTKPFDFPEGSFWICVSPKPGFREDMVAAADEVKVIVPGLGELNSKVEEAKLAELPSEEGVRIIKAGGLRWPDVHDAIRWAKAGKTVFLQPRNGRVEIDKVNLMIVMDLLKDHPQLRLSTQLHKILKVQ